MRDYEFTPNAEPQAVMPPLPWWAAPLFALAFILFVSAVLALSDRIPSHPANVGQAGAAGTTECEPSTPDCVRQEPR